MKINGKSPESLKREVGERARDLRKRAGFTSADSAADALDVSPTAVYEVERGENLLSAEMLLKMMDAYRAPAAAFYPGFNEGLKPTPLEALEIVASALRGVSTRKALPPGSAAVVERVVAYLSAGDPAARATTLAKVLDQVMGASADKTKARAR